jgi:CheY-like chemotaxis protein
MPKTILLIENDAPFAEEMSGALEAMGYQVRVTGDGKDGLDLARDLNPDAIVLCVELPKLSGYSICNKLKKDDALRSIPLILTSSEATEEVFEDHRKLKVRAEAYLIKPYVSATLLEKLSTLVGLPEGGGAPALAGTGPMAEGVEEEVVSLEDELALEPFAGEPGEEMPTLDLDALPDEPVAAGAGGGELADDLKLLDDAFDELSAPSARTSPQVATPARAETDADSRSADEAIEKALGVDRPVTSEDLEAASASLPEEEEASARVDLGRLADEADLGLGSLADAAPPEATSAFDALDALGGDDQPPVTSPGAAAPQAGGLADGVGAGFAAVAAAGAAVAGVAGRWADGPAGGGPGAGAADLNRMESELAERRAELSARDATLRELTERLREAEAALGEQAATAESSTARAEALAVQVKKAETEVQQGAERERSAEARAVAAEERAAGLESKLATAEARCRAAEQEASTQRRAAEQTAATLAAKSAELVTALAAAARLAVAEREAERLGAEVSAARRETDEARAEGERRAAELKRRIAEIEAANTKNEERVVKAYLKIKGDEKVRDKARKALSIALQLLEEGLPAEPTSEKRPHPVRE